MGLSFINNSTITGTLTVSGDTTLQSNLYLGDSDYAYWGNANDFYIGHDSTNTNLINSTGHLYISNYADDSDIIFSSDDGSGGITSYLIIDGGAEQITINKNLEIQNSVQAQFGNSGAMQLWHDGSNGSMQNDVGDLYIRQTADDKDIILLSDDGSGGHTAYITLDGGEGETIFSRNTQHLDSVYAQFGTGKDLKIYHDASNSNIVNETGAMNFIQNQNDGNMVFQSDDGSGGTATYFSLDGGSSATNELYTKWPDYSRIALGSGKDLQLYHDGSHSYISDGGTGHLQILSSQLQINNAGNTENMATFAEDGAVNLYHNGTVKFGTTADGVTVTGAVSITGDGSNATTLTESGTGDFAIDVVGDITLDAAGNQIFFKDNGTQIGTLTMTDGNLKLISDVDDKDIIFAGQDGVSEITALTLDMSNAGSATFNDDIDLAGSINMTGSSKVIKMNGGGYLDFDGTNLQFNTQRNPNTGTFNDTDKSQAGITLTGADADSYIRFYTTNANNTTATERMRISSSGNVGIGTNAPEEKLMVGGAIVSTGTNATSFTAGTNRAFLDLTSGGARLGHFRGTTAAGSGSVKIYSDSTLGITLDASQNTTFEGDVLIPRYLEHSGDSDTYLDFQTDRITLVAGGVEFVDCSESTQNVLTLGASSDMDVNMRGGDGYIFIQGSNGYIGINDITPSYPLDINANTYITGTLETTSTATFAGNIRTGTSTLTANTNFDNIVIEGAAHTGITIFSGTSSDGAIYFGDATATDSQGQIKYAHSSNAMIFSTDDTTALTINSDQSATFAGAVTVAGKISGVTAGTAGTDAVNLTQLNDAVTGVLSYQSTWNASTNSPTLASGTGTPGYYYIVSVAGSTDLDGITDWAVGDWAVFSDLATDAWQKIDNTAIGNVSGSGTDNRLVLWSGTSTVDSDGDFYVDGDTIYSVNLSATTLVDTPLVQNTSLQLGRDSHNYISFSADDQVIIRVADSHRVKLTSTDISPYTDKGYDLGTAAIAWNNVYAEAIYGLGKIGVNTTSVNAGIALQVAGAAYISGEIKANAMSAAYISGSSNMTFTTGATGEIVFHCNSADQINVADGVMYPETDSDVNLGKTDKYFATSYIDTGVFSAAVSVGTTLTVSGNTTLGDAGSDDTTINGQLTQLTTDGLGYKLYRTGGGTSMLISAAGDAEIEFGTDNGSGTNTTYWAIGKDNTDNSFKISNSDTLGTSDRVKVTGSSLTSYGNVVVTGDITPSGDINITQTADVGVLNTTNLDDGSAVGLSLTYPTSNVAAGDGIAIAIGVAGRGRSYIANSNVTDNLDASNLVFYTEDGGTIAEALTLDTNQDATFAGSVTLTDVLALPDGSVSAPSVTNTGDLTTGMYWPGDHQVGFSVDNSRKFYMSTTQAYFQNLSSGVSISAGGIDVTGNSTFADTLTGTFADFYAAGTGNDPIFHVKDTADTFVALFEGNRAGDTGANIHLRHWPTTAAESNRTKLFFEMKDDGDNVTKYATIGAYIDDYTEGTEDGNLRLNVMKAGTDTEMMRLDNNGVEIFGNVNLTADNVNLDWRHADEDQVLRIEIDSGNDAYFSVTGNNNYYFRTNSTTALTIDGSQDATFSGRVKTEDRFVLPTTVGPTNRWIYTDNTDTGTGSLTVQAGAGSAGYGGGLILYSHSHASQPGWVKAGISVGSGGKFGVNTQGTGGGTDVFTVDASGDTVIAGDVQLAATKKLYLDGSDNTYIVESSDGVIDFYGDNTFLVSMKQNGTQSEVVVNEGSGDVDFRVEANSDTHTFFVEAESTGKVGIHTDTPYSALSINSNGVPIFTTADMAETGLTIHNGDTGTAIQIGTYDAGSYSYIMSGYINSASTPRELRFYNGSTKTLALDTSGDATFAGNVDLTTDNKAIRLGSGGNLSIKYDGSNGKIENNTGNFYIINESDDKSIYFQTDDGSGGTTTYMKVDGVSEYTEFTKASKHMDGINAFFGSSADANIYHNGTDTWLFIQQADNGYIDFRNDDGSGGTTSYLVIDGNNELNRFYKRLQLEDNVKLTFGNITTPDLEIYHDASNSYITDTGTGSLKIGAANFHLMNAAHTEYMMTGTPDEGMILYYDNSTKFQTTSAGVTVTGGVIADSIGNDSSGSNISFTTNAFSWAVGSYGMQMNSAGTLHVDTNILCTGLTSDSTITLSASNLVLDGNSQIELDTSLASGASGTIIKIGTGTLTAGVCYMMQSDKSWAPCEVGDEEFSRGLIAIALGTSPTTHGMLTNGIFYDSSHSFTAGLPLFLTGDAGALSNTAPTTSGDLVRVVGYAVDTDEIYFCPDNTWVILD